MGRKCGCRAPLGRGEQGPHQTQCCLGEAYLHTNLVASSSIQLLGLATRDTGRKVGAAVPLSWEEGGSPSNTTSPGPSLTSLPSGILIHPAVCAQQAWAENWVAGCAPFGRGGFPSNTVWPGPICLPPHQVPSSSVQPLDHNTPTSQTGQDRQDRQNGPVA